MHDDPKTEAREEDVSDSDHRVRNTVDSFSNTRRQQQDRNNPFRTRRSTSSLQFQERELPERQTLRSLTPSVLCIFDNMGQ